MLQPVFSQQQNAKQHQTPIKRNKSQLAQIKTADSEEYVQTLECMDALQLCQQFQVIVRVTEDQSMMDSGQQLERQLDYEAYSSVVKLNFDSITSSLKKKSINTDHFEQKSTLSPNSKLSEPNNQEAQVVCYDCITPIGREIKMRPELNRTPIKDRNANRHRDQ